VTRAAVDSVNASLKAADKKKAVDTRFVCCWLFSCAELTTRISRTKKPTPKFPSGLVPNWQSKISVPRQMSKMKTNPCVESHSTLGGLEDDDAFGNIPAVLIPEGRRANQKDNVCCDLHGLIEKFTDNIQLVLIDSDSNPDSDTPLPESQKSTTVDPKEPKAPKAKSQQGTLIKATKASTEVLVVTPTATESEDLSNLPEFTRAAWPTRFLPTLYTCLGCSHSPFVISLDMVQTIQDVLDYVYPDADYRVRAGDRFYKMVCEDPFMRTHTDRQV
jgi:hypothetical protein